MSWLGSLRRTLFGPRLRALVTKEFNQIRRDRRLVISLIIPPLLQLTLFGYALSASVSDLRLGIVDESRTSPGRRTPFSAMGSTPPVTPARLSVWL